MSLNSTQLREHLRHLTQADAPGWKMPLWDYALGLYGRDGIEPACLRLQDEFTVDVCELIWVCWLACHGLTLDRDAPEALEPVRHWQQETTRPLRALRRRLKPTARASSPLTELRETIKRAELLAERESLAALQRLSERGQGIRFLKASDPGLPRRLLEHLAPDDESALELLAVFNAHFDRPTVESWALAGHQQTL